MPARVLLAVLVASLASCAPSAETSRADDGASVDLTVEAYEMGYEPQRIEVAANEGFTLRLVNAGALRHDLALPDGTRSETLNAGESTVVEIGSLSESMTAWCSIPGHRNAGMELEVIVE